MKKLIYAFIILNLLISNSYSEILKSRNNKDIDINIHNIQNGLINQKIPLKNIKEIIFTQKNTNIQNLSTRINTKDLNYIKSLFKQADTYLKKYPDTDGIVLVDEGEYILNSDGTNKFISRFVGYINKESLINSYGTVSRFFEQGRSKINVIKAAVYSRNGEIFPLNKKKDITITPPQGEELFFTQSMSFNYSLNEVKTDSIVEHIIEVEEYNPFEKDFFFPVWGFQSEQPTVYSSLKITIPKDKTLYYSTKNIPDNLKKPKIINENNNKTYFWKLENIPPLVNEPFMPQYYDIAPNLVASIFNDWSRIIKWAKKMHLERINSNKELYQFTQELVKDCKTQEEKVAKIYHYIQQNIRYIAIKMGVASGWGGYDANETWKKQFGCCIDKALLFTAMLKNVGIDSSVIFLNTNFSSDTNFEIPTIYFEHAISLVKLDNKRLFLDATNYDSRYPSMSTANQGVQCLNIFDEKIEEIPFSPPEEVARRNNFILNIQSNGDVTVNYSNEFTGDYETGVRGYYKSIKENERPKILSQIINSISPGKLTNYEFYNLDDISKPFYFKMDYVLFNYPIKAADLLIFELPYFKLKFSEISLENRKYPIEYNWPLEETNSYTINVPDNLSIQYIPPNVSIQNEYASFSLNSNVNGQTINIVSSFKRYKRLVPVKDYKAYKELLTKISKYTEDKIFFKVKY